MRWTRQHTLPYATKLYLQHYFLSSVYRSLCCLLFPLIYNLFATLGDKMSLFLLLLIDPGAPALWIKSHFSFLVWWWTSSGQHSGMFCASHWWTTSREIWGHGSCMHSMADNIAGRWWGGMAQLEIWFKGRIRLKGQQGMGWDCYYEGLGGEGGWQTCRPSEQDMSVCLEPREAMGLASRLYEKPSGHNNSMSYSNVLY